MLARILYRLYLQFTDEPKKTAIHPDYRKLISYAFSVPDENGKPIDYYCFETPADMPTNRYHKWNDFLEDYNRRFENQELKEVLEEILKNLNENSVDGVTNAMIITKYAIQRTSIAMDTDLFMRFMSVTYFTLDENLLYYDYDIGTKKIERWTQNGIHAFFLKEPVKRWLPLTELSSEDLVILQTQKDQMLRFYKKLKDGSVT